jgi:hypothetical protein
VSTALSPVARAPIVVAIWGAALVSPSAVLADGAAAAVVGTDGREREADVGVVTRSGDGRATAGAAPLAAA